MPQRFCIHLEEYGVLFTRAEAAYRAFNAMVDRAVSEKDTPELKQSLDAALESWQQETRALREAFEQLHSEGRIILPGSGSSGARPIRGHGGSAQCRECGRPIPRLTYPEWQIAYNGAINFRGEELDLENPDLAFVD